MEPTILSSDNTIPSSTPPRDNAIFSDEPTRASSPPSSPPGFPWQQQETLRDPAKSPSTTVKSAFSLLGKRKALEDIADNVRPSKRAAIAASKPETKSLAQMQISLGQEVQKKCKVCGMEYVASSSEDRKLHDKYHKQNTEGYDVGKDFVQKARDGTVFEGTNDADSMCAIDCFDKPARKKKAHAVLEVVQQELGAVPIPESDTWDVQKSAASTGSEPRFKAYLYIRGTKCVGFLLIETVTEAHRVLEPETASIKRTESARGASRSAVQLLKARKQAAEEAARQAASEPIKLSNETHPAKIGISRIWTSPNHRHQNIAMTLLNTALLHHCQLEDRATRTTDESPAPTVPARHVPDEQSKPQEEMEGKSVVAFSQPTEAGARLARRWFGKLYGWFVYVD